MRIDVGGRRLFFDVVGAKLAPEAAAMRERPTLLLLHGGPGMDHAHYRPAFDRFADVAQVIYLDHRGHGRSDRTPADEWNVARWGDDVKALCDALGIAKPVVLGTSFGGIVALSYATRHPAHPGKLILASTEARAVPARVLAAFERLGGERARGVAERFLAGAGGDAGAAYAKVCLPLYHRRTPMHEDALARCIARPEIVDHYFRPGGEASTVDFVPELGRITCPTLILAGEDDPITPVENSVDMAAALPAHLVRLRRYADTGHTVFDEEPAAFEAVEAFLRE